MLRITDHHTEIDAVPLDQASSRAPATGPIGAGRSDTMTMPGATARLAQPEHRALSRDCACRGACVVQACGHRYASDQQRILQEFYRAGGIEVSFHSDGALAAVRLVPASPQQTPTCGYANQIGVDPCDCDCADEQDCRGGSAPGHSRNER